MWYTFFIFTIPSDKAQTKIFINNKIKHITKYVFEPKIMINMVTNSTEYVRSQEIQCPQVGGGVVHMQIIPQLLGIGERNDN